MRCRPMRLPGFSCSRHTSGCWRWRRRTEPFDMAQDRPGDVTHPSRQPSLGLLSVRTGFGPLGASQGEWKLHFERRRRNNRASSVQTELQSGLGEEGGEVGWPPDGRVKSLQRPDRWWRGFVSVWCCPIYLHEAESRVSSDQKDSGTLLFRAECRMRAPNVADKLRERLRPCCRPDPHEH